MMVVNGLRRCVSLALMVHDHQLHEVDPSIGIQVYKEYLQWALKSVNNTYIGQFGSLYIPITPLVSISIWFSI